MVALAFGQSLIGFWFLELPKRSTTRSYKLISIKDIRVLTAILYIVVCGWLVYASIKGQTGITVCPSKILYHIPCPGCGITRATLRFLQYDIMGALYINPNVILSIAFLVFFPIILFVDLIIKRGIISAIYDRTEQLLHKKVIFIPLIIIEILIWFHNIEVNM